MAMVRDDPGGTFAGICTFTWYNPMKPGVKPENCTGALMPPILAVAGFGDVIWRLVVDAGCPSTIAPLTGPNPVAQTITVSFAAAGLEADTGL